MHNRSVIIRIQSLETHTQNYISIVRVQSAAIRRFDMLKYGTVQRVVSLRKEYQ